MTWLVRLFFIYFMSGISSAWAAGEIGYVEDFSGLPSHYKVTRGSQLIPLSLCLPLYNGDLIEALDENGHLTLRLVDRADPVTWTRADRENSIKAEIPQTGFWSSLLDWTVTSLSPIDDQKRQLVLTSIRSDDDADFGVPLLATPQTLSSGTRTIALGWLKPSQVVEISLSSKSGKKLVKKAKGKGGLWISPELDLRAGTYRLEVTAAGNKVSGTVTVSDPAKLPEIPPELQRESVPEPLRRTAQALWLSAQQNGQYRLEALHILAGAHRSASETTLLKSLIAGKRFQLP